MSENRIHYVIGLKIQLTIIGLTLLSLFKRRVTFLKLGKYISCHKWENQDQEMQVIFIGGVYGTSFQKYRFFNDLEQHNW